MAEREPGQVMAGLLGPINASEQGVVFGLLDRSGHAAHFSHFYERRLTELGEQHPELVEQYVSPAQPFMLGEELDGAFAASTDPTEPGGTVHESLMKLSLVRSHAAPELAEFTNWMIEDRPEDEGLWGAILSLRYDPGASTFDRIRLLMIITANLVPEQPETAYSYVTGAAMETSRLTDPREKIQAHSMLVKAMKFAGSVSSINLMNIIGNGQPATVELRIPKQ